MVDGPAEDAPDPGIDRGEPAPMEARDDWAPGLATGAHERISAAVRRGGSRAWANRGIAAFLWAGQVGLVLLVLGPLPALFGGQVEVGVRSGELAAELVGAWWQAGFSRPAASIAAGLGPRGIAASILWVILNYAMAGGVLTLLHTGDRGRRLLRFVLACRAYLFRFLRLFALAALLYAAVLWLDDRLFHALGGAAAPGWLHRLRGALTLGALGCIGLLFDVAKIRAVITGSRRMLRNLGRAVRFLGRNFPRLLLLYGVAGAPGVALAVGYAVIQPGVAGGAVLLPALIQALYALGRISVRFLLWGSELSLYRGLRTRELAAGSSSARGTAGLVK